MVRAALVRGAMSVNDSRNAHHSRVLRVGVCPDLLTPASSIRKWRRRSSSDAVVRCGTKRSSSSTSNEETRSERAVESEDGRLSSSWPVAALSAASLMVSVLGGAEFPPAALATANPTFKTGVPSSVPAPVQSTRHLTAEEQATINLFQKNTPSVVYITNLAERRDVFTLNITESPHGAGSGIVWDSSGHVVTNYHVIDGANELRVTFQDQAVYPASVVGFDEDKDIAVLQVNFTKPVTDSKMKTTSTNNNPTLEMRPLPIGTSSDLMVGQRVYAIGNPFGLDHTLTTGVISGRVNMNTHSEPERKHIRLCDVRSRTRV